MVKKMLYKRTIALGTSIDFRKDLRRSEPTGDSSIVAYVLSYCFNVFVSGADSLMRSNEIMTLSNSQPIAIYR